jgi:hypothetical protein
MKKVLFLTILPFLLLGTANVSAQVRIGGSDTPYKAAVLDLNADNETTPTGNPGGLALPRVALTAYNMQLNDADPVNGMLVYHTGSTLDGAGVYVWMTDKWVKTSTGSVAYTDSESITLSGTEFRRAALTGDVAAEANENTTTITANAVTSAKILDKTIATADIADLAVGNSQLAANAVTTDKIRDLSVGTADLADYSVTALKLNSNGATNGQALVYNGNAWAPKSLGGLSSTPGGGQYVILHRAGSSPFTFDSGAEYVPIACRSATSQVYIPCAAFLNSGKNAVDYGGTTVVTESNLTICTPLQQCACLFLTF